MVDIKYDTKFDAVPQFWQYLAGLNSSDLITELIQNDLDALVKQTVIRFESDRLICQGDGEPIDSDGWKRLSYLMGAGDLVPRKHHCIGIKNHGLKACFTIGDEFRVYSDGKHLHQTLYSNGHKNPPYPSAMEEPQEDTTAPKKGCKVVVEFRKRTLSVKNGEPLEIVPLSREKIKNLFERACREAPSRFIGAIRPRYRHKYVLELKHHELGTARFEYHCGRNRSDKGTVRYTRYCSVSGDYGNLPPDIRESCLLFTVPRNKKSNIEIPDFYKAPKGFYLEIAWETNAKGIPKSVKGYRRYPISYNGENANAFSGVGIHFSGPYVSTSDRHEASSASEINQHIDEKCKLALISLLRSSLVDQYSGKAFELLMSDTINPNLESLTDLVNSALELAAIPLSAKPAIKKKKRTPTTKNTLSGHRFGPRKEKGGTVKRIVIPVFTWDKSHYSRLLSSLCPPHEDIVDEKLPPLILTILAGNNCEGWSENHIRFDEKDVIERFQPMKGSTWFPWQNETEWQTQFGNPTISSKYLDVVLEALHNKSEFNFTVLASITPNVYLPDNNSVPTLMTSMRLGIYLPPGLSVDTMPTIIHPEIAQHQIFRSYKKWRPNKYTFTEFLEQVDLENADERVRRQFWEWISQNWQHLNRLPWSILAKLPIWPDDHDDLVTLQSLCRPKSHSISTLLTGIIRVPNRRLLKISRIAKSTRGPLYLRNLPNSSELSMFINEQLARFSLDKPLDQDEIHLFHQFEKNLADLLSNSAVREVISKTAIQGVALNMTNQLKHVSDLIQVNKDTKHLFLPPEHLLNRKTSIFEKVHGWQSKYNASSKHILWALQNDSQNTIALLPRLQSYLKVAKAEGKDPLDQDIKDIKCIPDNDKLYAPVDLVFRGVRGNYWGTWKHLISGKNLGANVQNIYTSVGVTKRSPTSEVSVEYFKWLDTQSPNVIVNNIESIIRQIDNNAGPCNWYKDYQDLPFIPVETSIDQVKLVSYGYTTRLRSEVVIPDFDEVVKSIRKQNGNRSVLLAVCQHPNVRNPLTYFFKAIGIRSLRDYAGSPIKVVGEEAQTAPNKVFEILSKLRSSKVSNQLRKRLDNLEFNDGLYLLKSNWRDTIQRIQTVALAKTIEGTFRIRRNLHVVPLAEAFDEATGTIWLSKSEDPIKAFFIIISRLIFTDRAKYLALILEEALNMDFLEDELPFQPGPYSNDAEDESGDEGDEPDDEQEPGGTDQTHPGEKPDPTKNMPHPKPIPEGGPKGNRRGNDLPPKNPSPGRPRSAIEERQKENLKQNQYAYHCQICLASHSVKELAPDNSYVEFQENRKNLIIAHHLDQVHAGGSRHAGNIIILCSHHHDYYGDTISRGDILKALSAPLIPRTIVFSSVIDGKQIASSVKGQVATVVVPLSGETFQCFFADHHLNYWRDKISVNGLPSKMESTDNLSLRQG